MTPVTIFSLRSPSKIHIRTSKSLYLVIIECRAWGWKGAFLILRLNSYSSDLLNFRS